jgi:Phage capsid family
MSRTIDELFADEQTLGQRYAFRRVRDQRWPVLSFDGAEVRTLLTTSTTDTAAAGVWAPTAEPDTPSPRRRRVMVGDLIPSVPIRELRVPYVRELNADTLEGGASATAEASAKPEVTISFEGAELNVRKITSWVPIVDEVADDATGLADYVDGRLRYLLPGHCRLVGFLGVGRGRALANRKSILRGILASTGGE